MTARLPAPREIRPMGPGALLASYDDTDTVLAATAALRDLAPSAALREAIPAERTLLLVAHDPLDLPGLRDLLSDLPAGIQQAEPPRPLTIDVVYDGEDLEDTARALGMSRDALIAAHSGTAWRASFAGFAPGFAYLLPQQEALSPSRAPHPSAGPVQDVPSSDAPPWSVPRRSQPRTRVPAGAVGLAAAYCGIYPRSSPGGWQLIGRTDAVLFDPSRQDPALLAPGTEVRFRAKRDLLRLRDLPDGGVIAQATGLLDSARRQAASAARQAAGAARTAADSARTRLDPRDRPRTPAAADSSLAILEAGPLALVQDAGRPGLAGIGVTSSGAFDLSALRRANRAVGNPPSAPGLEILMGPFAVKALAPAVIAVDGAGASVTVRRAVLTGAAAGADQPGDLDVTEGSQMGPIALDTGDVLRIGTARTGLRIVLALRGGVHAEPVLGSSSRDTLAELGPVPLRTGEVVARRRDTVLGPVTDMTGTGDLMDLAGLRGLGSRPAWSPHARDHAAIDVPVVIGPHDILLGADAVTALLEGTWTVRPDSDRVGVRLDGEALPLAEGADDGSMPSAPMVPGAIQVPPSGLPVVFGPDHPVTGGYPVIAVGTRRGLNRLAQAAPGREVRFVIAS